MKFSKTLDGYKAIRKDGQEITIAKSECGSQWVVRYAEDWDGDNTVYAKTKKELVDAENRIEACL